METKEEAMTKVHIKRNPYFQDALKFCRGWIIGKKKFTSEDARNAFGLRTPEPRIWGVIFQTLSREKLIVPSGWTTGKFKQCHQAPKRTWNYKFQPATQPTLF